MMLQHYNLTLSQSSRDYQFDNLKGLLIIFVVFGHCLEECSLDGIPGAIRAMIYCFHMPAFIFISGYFTYGHLKRPDKVLLNTLITYFLFNTAYELLIIRTTRVQIFTPQYIFWYLFALFAWRISVKYISLLKTSIAFAATIAFSLYIGCIHDADRFLAAQRVIAFYPFFLLGYKVAEKGLKSKIEKIPAFICIIAIVITETFVLSLHFAGIAPVKIWENIQHYEASGVTISVGIIIRLLSLGIGIIMTFAIFNLLPAKQCFLSQIGNRTDCIYVLSAFAVKLIYAGLRKMLTFESCSSLTYIIISIAATVMIVFLLSRDCVISIYREIIDFCGRSIFRKNSRAFK